MSVAGTKNFDQPPHDSNRTHLVFSTSGLLLGSRAPLVFHLTPIEYLCQNDFTFATVSGQVVSTLRSGSLAWQHWTPAEQKSQRLTADGCRSDASPSIRMSPVALAPCLKNQSLLLKRDLFEFKPAKGRHPMHSAACCDLQEVVLLVDLRTLPEAQKALESAVPLPCKVLLDRAGAALFEQNA